MTEHSTGCRQDFDRFVNHLRRDTFSMYELLREVQRSRDDEMPQALLDLAAVGSKAANIVAEIEALCAAVWYAPVGADDVALPDLEPQRSVERMLALVR